MSTVGLEFSGFVNPSLTWKTVSKGRSTLKSLRRPTSENSNMVREQNRSPKRVESQCSELGKTTGIMRCFNGNLEHIPLKKRRFLFCSPSPPPHSPYNESRELENSDCLSGHPTTTLPHRVEINISNAEISGNGGKDQKTRDEVYGSDQDFSGIEILAEAACIHMLDKPSANVDSSAICESVATLQKNSLQIGTKVQDSFSNIVGANCQTSEGARTSIASHDDRFHWDLNTPVDEWDCPLDDTFSSITKSGTVNVDCSVSKECSNMQTIGLSTKPVIYRVKASETPLDVTHVIDNVSGTELAQMKSCDACKPGVRITAEALLETVKNDLGLLFEVQEHGVGPSSCSKSDVDNLFDVSNVRVVDKVEAIDCSLDLRLYGSKMSFSEENSVGAAGDLHNVSMRSPKSTIQDDNSETSELDFLLKRIPAEASCGLDLSSCEAAEDSTKTMESDAEKENLQEHDFQLFQFSPISHDKQQLALSYVRTCEDTISDKKLNNVPCLKHAEAPGEMSESNEVEVGVRSVCDQPLEASQLDAKSGFSAALESEHMFVIHNSSCEDMAELEKRKDLDGSILEGGSDSYFEDGELRESEHCLFDNGGENREGEHVDHDPTAAADGPVAENVVAEFVFDRQGYQLNEHLELERGLPVLGKIIEEQNSCLHQTIFSAEGDADVGCLKANPSTSVSMSTPRNSSMDNPEVVDMDLDEGRKSSVVSDAVMEDENDGLEDAKDVHIKGVGATHCKRELQSRVEGLSDRSRDQRAIGVDGSLGRSRYVNTGYGGHPGSRYWNDGLRNVANPANGSDGEKFFGPSNNTSRGAFRQGMFPTSSGGRIHNNGRDEEFGMGIMKSRDFNSDSSQRYSRYGRNVIGMVRGGYDRTNRETTNPSNSMLNHFVRREHSFSSRGIRIGPHHLGRSHSRSRTRSPDPSHDGRMGRGSMQYHTASYFRGRRSPVRVYAPGQRFETTSGRLRSENSSTRPRRFPDIVSSRKTDEYETDDEHKRRTYLPRNQRSRSRSHTADFRSQGRVGKMKLPYPPSNDIEGQMSDRRSSPRIFRPGKRFDDMGSSGSLRSDDYVRPVTRPVRFQDVPQSSSRDDYRRKSRTTFDGIHPKTNNHDIEGNDRPFDYDPRDRPAPQSLRRGDSHGRGGDRRAVKLRCNTDRDAPPGSRTPK